MKWIARMLTEVATPAHDTYLFNQPEKLLASRIKGERNSYVCFFPFRFKQFQILSNKLHQRIKNSRKNATKSRYFKR